MGKIYLIRKGPADSDGIPAWVQLSGRAFYAFLQTPEAKGRHFIKLPELPEDSGDNTIVIEASKSEYVKWRREKDRGDYLRERADGISVVSYHALETDDGCFGEECVADMETDVEAACLKASEPSILRQALSILTEDEYRMIKFLYLSEEKHTEQEYADLTGIPRRTICGRKNRILKKIFDFFQD
ncbi:MAG: hypothetical protein LBS36_13210 [Oscillospiraceae bacterium]|jgi:DNA-directed RNA polymerase specialized sigma24 family protein|nr:hypothetical protein [Oscillospiraceae bacterium]